MSKAKSLNIHLEIMETQNLNILKNYTEKDRKELTLFRIRKEKEYKSKIEKDKNNKIPKDSALSYIREEKWARMDNER